MLSDPINFLLIHLNFLNTVQPPHKGHLSPTVGKIRPRWPCKEVGLYLNEKSFNIQICMKLSGKKNNAPTTNYGKCNIKDLQTWLLFAWKTVNKETIFAVIC